MTSNPANYKTCVTCDAKIDQGAKVHVIYFVKINYKYSLASIYTL